MHVRRKINIVALGDSLTAGLQTQQDILAIEELAPYTRHLETMAQVHLNTKSEMKLEIVNKGICGDCTIDMLARFSEDVIEQQPDHVIIIGGTNDIGWGRDTEEILLNLAQMYSIAEENKIAPVACSIPSILGFDDLIAPRLRLNRLIWEEAKRRSIPFIDIFTATVDPENNRLMAQYSGDVLHLNAKGYEKIAEAIFDEWLKRLLLEHSHQ